MNSGPSLDERYLDFISKTDQVFAQYPQLEALRHFIFRELLVQRKPLDWTGHVKHWMRPLRQRARSSSQLPRADVVMLVETHRKTSTDVILRLYRELVSRGISVRLISFRQPGDLPSSTLPLQFPAYAVAPRWTKDAWEALCDTVGELRDRALRRSFYYACANIRGLFDELNRMLSAVKPKIVLVWSTQMIGGASLVIASRSHAALTLLLQHGLLQPFYTPLIADYMLTWGESSNDTLVGLGVPRHRLIAVGSPRHDSMVPLADGSAKTMLLDALSLPEKPTFVFFSNGNDLARNGHAPLQCAKWLEEAAARYSNHLNIVVRLHPNEDGSLYRNCRHLRVAKNLPDLATTLDGCDWVGSLCSTVMYEALLYKKRVQQFYAEGWPELADNWRCGLAARVSSQVELLEMIDRLLSEGADNSQNHLVDRVFSNHGRATQAVADFVQSRLEKADKRAGVFG